MDPDSKTNYLSIAIIKRENKQELDEKLLFPASGKIYMFSSARAKIREIFGFPAAIRSGLINIHVRNWLSLSKYKNKFGR